MNTHWTLSMVAASMLLLSACGEGGDASADGGDGGAETCGDGELQTTEPCEGFELRGETCESQGFERGALRCTDSCTLDVSGCSTCGDGVINGEEVCEPDNLNGATCTTSHPYAVLGCNEDCLSFDTAFCEGYGDEELVQKARLCDFGFPSMDCMVDSVPYDERFDALKDAYLDYHVTSLAERECIMDLTCGQYFAGHGEVVDCAWLDEGGFPEYNDECSPACWAMYFECNGGETCDVATVVECSYDSFDCYRACEE